MTVLLVEDNEMNRDMLARRLERHGFDVAVAADGLQGVQMAASIQPSIILMDISLPVMDGWEAIRRLKADPNTTQIPIITLTAHALSEDRDRAFASGCVDFITKPVDFGRLFESIRRHGQGACASMSDTIHTLLLVDDDEMNRDMLGRRLERAGYRVVTAENGTQALTAVDHEPVDLILLDIMMPDLSGIEVLRRLRTRYSGERLPVIMVTAKTQSEDVVEALDLGANDYVTKPVDMAVALARIRTHIARRTAERALVESEERYALALQGSNDGLWDWKVGTDEVYYSPRWKAIMGYDEHDAVAGLASWFDRVHPDDVERVRADLDEHLRGRTEHFESEHRIRSGDGHYHWALVRGLAICGEDGAATRVAGSLTDITEAKVADALTNLPNRILFNDRLGRLLENAKRVPDFQFAMLLLDLDRFKNINDSLGHQAGDELLIQVAHRLEHSLRSTDTVARLSAGEATRSRVGGNTVARFGGDEFAVILSGLRHPTDATRAAERIGQVLAKPFEIAGQEVFVTTSIGIALSASRYERPEDMLRDADTALYRAKAGGRARYELFDAVMREQVIKRLQLETDLRHAVDRNQFVVHYQPIIKLADGAVTGLEALIRWCHPQRGLVPPMDFIPLAEDTGLIIPIGFWIIGEVCRQLRDWAKDEPGIPPLVVSVNLSIRQLVLPDLVDRLSEIADQHGIDHNRLELEITETSMMADPDAVRTTVERLKTSGFRVSIDDFGTGYSSLSYLQRFPVDRLKIDRSFLAQLATHTESQAIIQTIVLLAEHLRLEVVAEGIETIGQLTHLQSIHCEFGQGFYFSRPVPADPMGRLLRGEQPAPTNAESR